MQEGGGEAKQFVKEDRGREAFVTGPRRACFLLPLTGAGQPSGKLKKGWEPRPGERLAHRPGQ